jgi:peptidoglycan/LPS O-acetylase OafA/YrhL
VLAAISVLSIGWAFVVPVLFHDLRVDWLATMNPIVGLWAFMFGVLCGTRYERAVQIGRKIRPAQWLGIEIAAVILAIAANGQFLIPQFSGQAVNSFFADLGAAPYYALLVLTLALSRGPLVRFLSTRQMVYMGEVSFSFYLVHQIVIRWYADHVLLFNKPFGFVFVLGASSAAAALIFHAVEKPSRTAIVNAWKRQQYNQPLQRNT